MSSDFYFSIDNNFYWHVKHRRVKGSILSRVLQKFDRIIPTCIISIWRSASLQELQNFSIDRYFSKQVSLFNTCLRIQLSFENISWQFYGVLLLRKTIRWWHEYKFDKPDVCAK